MSMEIRKANLGDVNYIADGGLKFYESGRFDLFGLSYDKEGFACFVSNLISMPTFHILVAQNEKGLIGSIAGCASPWLLCPTELMVQELWWFVYEDDRGFAGIRLLKALEKWCKEIGSGHLLMIGLVNEEMKRMDKFYARMKYNPVEIQYHKEIK